MQAHLVALADHLLLSRRQAAPSGPELKSKAILALVEEHLLGSPLS